MEKKVGKGKLIRLLQMWHECGHFAALFLYPFYFLHQKCKLPVQHALFDDHIR